MPTAPHLTRRRAIALGGAGLASLAVGAGAVASGVRRTAVVDQLQRSVGVIGDSITAESEDLLYDILRSDGFSDVRIDAERNRRITVGSVPRSGLDVLEEFVAEGFAPTAWIIALGTNDIGSYADAPAFGEVIQAMLFLIPATTPVVWMDTYLPDRLDSCREFNGELERLLEERGPGAVASWHDANSQPGESLLRSDQIHPNERGHVVFPTLLAATLRRLLLTLA